VITPTRAILYGTLCVLAAGVAARTQDRSAKPADSTRRGGSIIGRLINESGQPIPGAGINVRAVGATGAGQSIGTDEDGKFRSDDLAPGAYTVSAYVAGYVPAIDSPDRQYYRPGETVILRMVKGGVVTGKVTDSEGEPLIGARVSAVRVRDAEGRPIRGSRPSNSRQTDDRGVYRIYGLQSGSYLVVVNGSDANYYPSTAFEGGAPSYYPSTTRDAATEVAVHAGEEIPGIDIRYRGDKGYIVSGSFSVAAGSNSAMSGVWLSLAHSSSGALESSAYTSLRGGERSFAFYGVPDGEYDLLAQMSNGPDNSAASSPRRVKVKGTDVTGIELTLAPLGSIAGRVLLDALPESERRGDCKKNRGASIDDTLIVARRDELSGAKDPSSPVMLFQPEATPDDKGEFKIFRLNAGRYRLEQRLPTEDWFVRSITVGGPQPSANKAAASDQRIDAASAGVAISSGQHATGLTITMAEGAAGIRGKVVPASESVTLPSRLRVHLVPAEVESADDILRYAEAAADGDGAFSIGNLAPGRYFVLARAVSDEEFAERTPSPLAWDAARRAKLRREAVAANVILDLNLCQHLAEYVLKYKPPSAVKPHSSKSRV
jgi:Carboxypeptidase regulatory-like domain